MYLQDNSYTKTIMNRIQNYIARTNKNVIIPKYRLQNV